MANPIHIPSIVCISFPLQTLSNIISIACVSFPLQAWPNFIPIVCVSFPLQALNSATGPKVMANPYKSPRLSVSFPLQALSNFRYRPSNNSAFKTWLSEFARLAERRHFEVQQVGCSCLCASNVRRLGCVGVHLLLRSSSWVVSVRIGCASVGLCIGL